MFLLYMLKYYKGSRGLTYSNEFRRPFCVFYACGRCTHAHRHFNTQSKLQGSGFLFYLMGGVKRIPDPNAQPVS